MRRRRRRRRIKRRVQFATSWQQISPQGDINGQLCRFSYCYYQQHKNVIIKRRNLFYELNYYTQNLIRKAIENQKEAIPQSSILQLHYRQPPPPLLLHPRNHSPLQLSCWRLIGRHPQRAPKNSRPLLHRSLPRSGIRNAVRGNCQFAQRSLRICGKKSNTRVSQTVFKEIL